MAREQYLSMDPKALSEHLIAEVMTSPEEGQVLVDALAENDRYREDFAYRAVVDTAQSVLFSLRGEYSQVIALCGNLIDRTKDLQLWQLLATNQELLGNAYYVIGIFERAMEFYHAAIKTEEEHGLRSVTPTAYSSIALIYKDLRSYEEACRYLKIAIEALEKGGTDQPNFYSKWAYHIGDMSLSLCLSGRPDEAKEVLERLERIDRRQIAPESGYICAIAEMYRAFYHHEYEKAKAYYREARDLLPQENRFKHMAALSDLLDLSAKFGCEEGFYREELDEVEKIRATGEVFTDPKLYVFLRKYYLAAGKTELFEQVEQEYIKLLEENVHTIRKRQLDSLQVVDDLIRDSEDLADMESQNDELKLVAEEAIRHKNALQEAYHRIEVINELGRKITSSLDLDEVVDSIYQNLCENVPLNSFCLMRASEAENKLHSVVFYENRIHQPNFSIDLDNEKSFFVKCYKSDRPIFSHNICTDGRYDENDLIFVGDGENTKSIIFMPLSVGEDVIGALSIQHYSENIYTEKHIAFLEELLPYLAIALNNAVRSWTLEREIRSHLQTQRELEAANQKLSHLSSLDGLTQISNRRDFESRVIEMMERARREQLSIAVFMFDIDNFKMYNDTYGHLEGDEALKKVARIIRDELEKVEGLSARFGGEEFIGATLGMDLGRTEQLAQKIREAVYDLDIPNRYAPLGRLTISIGVAIGSDMEVSRRSEIMRLADDLLYEAKNTGKNRVAVRHYQKDKK
ncbi:MAG: sensor domain-containing diguanylate cyclase [Peptostreptococcaceae bacterium]|nr:sensor domain-containing diguanylate cyclase [Peptostreptococcaceae bacterium]